MAYKLINATDAKVGTSIIVDGAPCTVKMQDISKTGKHGHAKVRIEAVGIIDGKKKVLVVPGHERMEVPLIEKKKGQVLSVSGNKASVMDIDTFENFDVEVDEEIKNEVTDGKQVEYWVIEGVKMIKRVIG